MEEYKKSKKDFITNLQNVFSENNIFPEYGEIGFIKDNNISVKDVEAVIDDTMPEAEFRNLPAWEG